MAERSALPTVTVALLGAGYWGSNLCRVLAQSKRFNLKWVTDLNPATLERARRVAPMAMCRSSCSGPAHSQEWRLSIGWAARKRSRLWHTEPSRSLP